MFDDFLSSTLKIIIVLDIIGLIAYFVLGAIKAQKQKQVPLPQTLPGKRSWWRRSSNPLPPEPADSLQEACVSLKRVLYSFEKGLI